MARISFLKMLDNNGKKFFKNSGISTIIFTCVRETETNLNFPNEDNIAFCFLFYINLVVSFTH